MARASAERAMADELAYDRTSAHTGFLTAIRLYDASGETTLQREPLNKLIQYDSSDEKYDKAIEWCEYAYALFGVTEGEQFPYIYQATLCRLAREDGVEAVRESLNQYTEQLDDKMVMMDSVMTSVEERDIDGFTRAVHLTEISDGWEIMMLLRIKHLLR
jgi:hypothetical protein